MASDDNPYTFNPLSNDDKALLLSHGYKPGELDPADEQELVRELREDSDNTSSDSENEGTIADEQDGTD